MRFQKKKNNPRILVLLFPVLIFLPAILSKGNQPEILPLNSRQINEMLLGGDSLTLIDGRDSLSFSRGHIKDALHIDPHQPEAEALIGLLDPAQTYVIYCRTHNRSLRIIQLMRDSELEFETVYLMVDGFLGWSRNELPIVIP